MTSIGDLQSFLNEKAEEFSRPEFMENDPIVVLADYSGKADIEIMGFLTATIAWGQRKTIIRNARRLGELMGHAPYEFLMEADLKDPGQRTPFLSFKHRTFQGVDLDFFLRSLQALYKKGEGLEGAFSRYYDPRRKSVKEAIGGFREQFFALPHEERTRKHVADPYSGASAKRINMFLRWMVRDKGVDQGLWKAIDKAALSCPLDVHSGKVARELGLLKRKQNDWKAVEELDANLRRFDPADPVKYDLALYGIGVFGY